MPAERGDRAGDGAVDAAWSVTSASNQACAGAELGGQRLEPLGLEPDQRHARAARRGQPGGLLADAAGGAGDEHDLAVELLASSHGLVPL